jgi:FMN-dependent NADH-azoreductase
MTNILYVTSSPRPDASLSNRVGQRLVDALRAAHPDATVTVRDLGRDPLPHIDQDFVIATRTPAGATTSAQRIAVSRSDALIAELARADIVVIAAGMINFSIPSTLKTWIDNIARPGRTFSYSEAGPKGLVTGKRVIVVAASGGIYSDKRALDFQIPYLRQVLGFLGMTNVEVIDVEGTGLGPDAAENAVAAATRIINERYAPVLEASAA